MMEGKRTYCSYEWEVPFFLPPTPVNEHIPTPLTFFQNASKQPLLPPSFFVGPFETEFLLFAFWLGRVSKTREKW